MEFGEKLKYLRESKKLGVNQLAVKSGVNASNISRLEKGERKDPTFETVKKLTKALGVSVSYFDDESNGMQTVIAHIDEDISEEEMKEILDYITYIKSKHRKH